MVTWLPDVAAQRSLAWAPLTVRMFQREALVSTRPHRFRYARRNIPHTLHYITSTGVRRRSYLQDVAHAAYRLAVTVQYAGQSAYSCFMRRRTTRDTSSGRARNNEVPALACTSHTHLIRISNVSRTEALIALRCAKSSCISSSPSYHSFFSLWSLQAAAACSGLLPVASGGFRWLLAPGVPADAGESL